MTELNCESICMAAMASVDGYPAEFTSGQIEAHLAGCPDCRHQLTQLRSLSKLFDRQKRRQGSEYIWTAVKGRLRDAAPAQSATPTWQPFVLLGLVLVGYKLVEMIPDRDAGLLFKLVPILFIVAVFGFFKENPFKINAELRFEGEEGNEWK